MASLARPPVAFAPAVDRPRIRGGDAALLLAANGVLIVAMWVRHGGLDQLTSVAGIAVAIGQLTALIGTYLALSNSS
jgi:hypothetical protein